MTVGHYNTQAFWLFVSVCMRVTVFVGDQSLFDYSEEDAGLLCS